MRTPIRIEPIPADELEALERLYHQTKDVRVHERAQMVLLSVEQGLTAAQIAVIVRSSEQTVRTWLKRFQVEGAAGLADKPRPGAPPKTTPAYRQRLVEVVRQRPRSLGQPYSLWTLQRLADYMADESGIRVTAVTVRQILGEHEIVLSRPQHKVSSPDPEYQVKKRRSKRSATV
jgi:transposase